MENFLPGAEYLVWSMQTVATMLLLPGVGGLIISLFTVMFLDRINERRKLPLLHPLMLKYDGHLFVVLWAVLAVVIAYIFAGPWWFETKSLFL